MIEIVLGIGLVSFLLMFLAFNLQEEHFILSLLMIVVAVTMLMLIPKSTIDNKCLPVVNKSTTVGDTITYQYDTYCLSANTEGATNVTFHKIYTWFYRAFWMYVVLYFVYRVLIYMGMLIPGEKNE